jgi:hypothetical protein
MLDIYYWINRRSGTADQTFWYHVTKIKGKKSEERDMIFSEAMEQKTIDVPRLKQECSSSDLKISSLLLRRADQCYIYTYTSILCTLSSRRVLLTVKSKRKRTRSPAGTSEEPKSSH